MTITHKERVRFRTAGYAGSRVFTQSDVQYNPITSQYESGKFLWALLEQSAI